MMRPGDDGVSPRKRRRISPSQAAPYVLRQLLDDLPLATEDPDADIHITCVEYWNDNLYIGTSAAEVLHFVCLPPDLSDKSSESSFILASRLPIFFSQNSTAPTDLPGVQQIVLLPTANKACILCNGTVTFYLLPELSPAFGNTKVNNCRWIGGVDLNLASDETEPPTIMVALQNRIMLVRIGDDARRIRNIEFPGCLVAARRGTIACAADTHAYSLLEVEHQQKIPLFPISSSNETFESGQVEEMPAALPLPSKTSPLSSSPNTPSIEGHAQGQSLNSGIVQPNTQTSPQDPSSSTPEPFPDSGTPRRSASQERGRDSEDVPPDSQSNSVDKKPLPPVPKPPSTRLKPHVVSASSNEFLLLTGTAENEPGVGMFVNMDGDMDRSTINFDRYPESIAIDKSDEDNLIQSDDDVKEECILAVIETGQDGQKRKYLEVQRLDIDPGDAENQKRRVEVPFPKDTKPLEVGLRHTASPSQLDVSEMGGLLRMVRLKTPSLLPHIPATDPRTQASIEQLQKEKELFESQELTDSEGSRKGDDAPERGWEAERNAEEAKFARALGRARSSLIMWAGNQIWRVVKNPLTVQLDEALQKAQGFDDGGHKVLDRSSINQIIQSVQGIEPTSEADFLGLNYVKQKASLILFGDLVFMDLASRTDTVIRATEQALVEGNLDPRMALILIPLLREEVLQGPQGIWIHAGLAAVAETYIGQSEKTEGAIDGSALDMIKRFLLSWQQKRGYGSITDETYVFDSVDAALLHLLLEQDSVLTAEQRSSSPIRTELNRLVDNWKGNFDRAVMLLETYHRLFILSRLYQSRKMSRNVLKTWRRIIEGEEDIGGEVTASGAELQMRRYLVKIRDAQLVEEYGSWLAERNPKLGIQVFADGTSRVKLEPTDVVALLKERAPNAVQAYMEHLVFFKNYTQYANDLVSYYLDTVLSVLQSNPAARASLTESYSTYRALRPPKPTYMNFITANIPSEPWWQARLRLLQLLGGGSSTQFSSMSSSAPNLTYSIPAVLARIEPFQNELVSESIILDGLQGRHQEALRLLTHGLGDYDSAVRYCLFGGPRSTSSTGALTEFAERPRQSELFRHVLDEFLRIEDPTERLEHTCDLLARFSSWFDVREVLELVPDDWSVEIMSVFLGHVFRTLVSQTREARVQRALSAGLNLRVGTEYIEGVEKAGGWIEDDEGLRKMRGGGNEKPPSDHAQEGSEFGDMVDATGDA